MKKLTKIIAVLIYFIFTMTQLYAQEAAYYCTPCNAACDVKAYDHPGTCEHCGMPLVKMTPEEHAQQEHPVTVAFYLQDGVEVLDFAGPMEVFSYAGFKVFTVSKTKEPIKAQRILTVTPDYSIEDAPKADIMAFFGGNSSLPSKDPEVINWVKNQSVDYHFSVCTGAFVLANSGILDGKTVTTFHNAIDNLKDNFPKAKVLSNVRFVDNGKVITTAGISAGIDGALHLVAKLKGLPAARLAAYYMEYDKWKPGEGLILSDDSPYQYEKLSAEVMKAYEGTYEFEDDLTLTLIADKEGNTLHAVIKDKVFPIFYVAKDQYVNVAGKQVDFVRENGQIVGFSVEEKPIFKKLSDKVDGEARKLVASR